MLTGHRGSGACRVQASYVTETPLVMVWLFAILTNEQYVSEYYREFFCGSIKLWRIWKFIVVATMCFNWMN
jgi:uncharacterized protein (DUF608 family)